MPDPIGDILDGVGSAASEAAAAAFNAAMKALWSFATALLGGALQIIDTYTAPNVDPRSGPLAGLIPTTVWLGSVVLVFMAFVQIGKGLMSGGRGFGRIFIGLMQYVVVTAAGLTVLNVGVAACDSLARFLLDKGLHVDSWSGINGQNSVLENATNTVSGVGLGVIGLLCVIPAAIGFLLESLARNAAVLIIAATIPIVAGGLVSDATRRWFWITVRWVAALLVMTPAIALTVVIGMRLAQGAAGAPGQQQGAGRAAVAAVVAGLVLIVALCMPLAMFKLFAFVDPSSLSGSGGWFAGRGASGGGGTAGSSEAGAESAGEGRFASMLDPAGMGSTAASIAGTGSGILDAVGAGHPGGPGSGGSSGRGGSRRGGDTGDGDTGESDGSTPDAGGSDTGPGAAPDSPDGGVPQSPVDPANPTAGVDPVHPAGGGGDAPAAGPGPSAEPPAPPALGDTAGGDGAGTSGSSGGSTPTGGAVAGGEAGEAAAVAAL